MAKNLHDSKRIGRLHLRMIGKRPAVRRCNRPREPHARRSAPGLHPELRRNGFEVACADAAFPCRSRRIGAGPEAHQNQNDEDQTHCASTVITYETDSWKRRPNVVCDQRDKRRLLNPSPDLQSQLTVFNANLLLKRAGGRASIWAARHRHRPFNPDRDYKGLAIASISVIPEKTHC
jgi:hypothetical protein